MKICPRCGRWSLQKCFPNSSWRCGSRECGYLWPGPGDPPGNLTDDGRRCGEADARPSWDTYFLEMAKHVATRSVCSRHKVGCLLVKDRRVLTTGYNGPPRGMAHCSELGGCARDLASVESGSQVDIGRCLHAEQNAIIQAAVHGVMVDGDIICYSTLQPCLTCSKMLINVGVVRVVFREGHPDLAGMKMLDEARVKTERIVEVRSL